MDVLNIINIVILGILAIASAVLVIFFVPVLRELRKTIGQARGLIEESRPKIDSITQRIDTMAAEEITPLIGQVRELVAETRPKIDSITQKIDTMTDEDIKPLASNVKGITATVNEEVAKVNGIVDNISDMVSKTHEVVSLYQDKAVIPAIEVISLWAGIKKGAYALFGREGREGG